MARSEGELVRIDPDFQADTRRKLRLVLPSRSSFKTSAHDAFALRVYAVSAQARTSRADETMGVAAVAVRRPV